MYIEWKNPLCPKTKLIIVDAHLYFFPIFDFFSSISGKIENMTTTKIKINLFLISKNSIDNNAIKNPNAKCV